MEILGQVLLDFPVVLGFTNSITEEYVLNEKNIQNKRVDHGVCLNDCQKCICKHINCCGWTHSTTNCMPNARFPSHCTGKVDMQDWEGMIWGLETVNIQ